MNQKGGCANKPRIQRLHVKITLFHRNVEPFLGTGTNGEPFHVLVLGVELRLELAVHFPHRQLARLQSRQVIESELGTTYRETSIAYSACGTSIANACVRI